MKTTINPFKWVSYSKMLLEAVTRNITADELEYARIYKPTYQRLNLAMPV